MLKAVVFDFDGLIVDTEPPVYQAWAEVYERLGLSLSRDFWASIIGRGDTYFDPMADLEQCLGRGLDREAITRERRARLAELLAGQPLLPGVEEWHREASRLGLKQAVASSSSRSWVVGHLRRLGLDNWECIRCREDVPEAKPAPDLYLAVLECLGLRPDEALALEDSSPGVASAKAAGLFCVAVPSAMTAGMDLSAADLRLESLLGHRLEDLASGWLEAGGGGGK